MPFLPSIYSFASEVNKKKNNNNFKWLETPNDSQSERLRKKKKE